MIAVIQCAGSKRPEAGYFKDSIGHYINFVGQPNLAPPTQNWVAARPDDPGDDGRSWREQVVDYNNGPDNPFNLFRAIDLYRPTVYRELVNYLGDSKVYVLSAGWGLIRADWKTPNYDITFTSHVKKKAPWKYRSKAEPYRDLCHIPSNTAEDVFFFGGNDYVGGFVKLTKGLTAKRTVFYNSSVPPSAPGCVVKRFPASRNMNWQYDCAEWFIEASKGVGYPDTP